MPITSTADTAVQLQLVSYILTVVRNASEGYNCNWTSQQHARARGQARAVKRLLHRHVDPDSGPGLQLPGGSPAIDATTRLVRLHLKCLGITPLQPVGVHDLGKRPFLWLPRPVWSADFQNQLTSTEVLAGNAIEGVHHVLETFAGSKALACTLDHGMCLPVLIYQLT